MKRALLAACVILVVLSGCDSAGNGARWAAEVRRLGQAADAALASGDTVAARDYLSTLARLERPTDVAASDWAAVSRDARFRLATLELQESRPLRALEWADGGLKVGEPDDLFAANLLVVRGRALEQIGDDVAAAASYHMALRINERLFNEALAAAGADGD